VDPAKTKFVNDLFNKFSTDMMAGAIEARLQWHLFDQEILDAVRAWAISEAGYDAVQHQVDLGAGLLGIPSAGHHGRAAAVVGFAQTLFSIAQSRGDPPFAPAFRERAFDVATGRLNTTQALQLMLSNQPAAAAVWQQFGPVFFSNAVTATVVNQMARVAAVLAMPRNQLYEFFASLHRDKTEGIRAAFGLALAEVQARASGDVPAARELTLTALSLAAQTPEVEDDIQAIDQLVKLPPEVLVERDIVESASRISQLAPQTQSAPALGHCIDAVHTAARRKSIEPQVLPNLADAAETLLQAETDHASWMSIAETAVRLAARAGRQAKAKAMLAGFRQRADDKERRLAKILEPEVRYFSGDPEGALALLKLDFEAKPAKERWMGALPIVWMWPPGRPGREHYVDALWAGMTTFAPSLADVFILFVLTLTTDKWGDEPAAALLERLNLEQVRAGLSDERRKSFDEAMKSFERLRPRAASQPVLGRASTGLNQADSLPTAVLQALRQRLLSDVEKGRVVGARGVELTAFLKDVEALLRMPHDTVEEVQAKAQRSRELTRRLTPFLDTASYDRPLPPEGSLRARMRGQLRWLRQLVVQDLSLVLQQAGERDVEHDLLKRAFELDDGVVRADDDDHASGFWPSLRGLAIEVGEHARRGHLTLAHPIFAGPEPRLDVSAVFFSGGEPARARLADACVRRGLSLLVGGGPGTRALERWGELRSAAVAVFDLTVPPGPDLAAVCYELGIALALGKPVVPLAAPDRPAPFDVDLKTIEFGPTLDANQLLDAIEASLFQPSRGEPGNLANTLAALERELGELGRQGTMKVALDLARSAVDDPVRFRTAVGDVLGLWGAAAPLALLPAWPADYPNQPCCFHVMPFGSPWSDEVARIAEAACGGEVKYVRGDRGREQNIMRRIWSELAKSTHVLVDLTGFNPNVALELGIAHTLGRSTRIVAQKDTVSHLFLSIAKLHVYTYGLEDGGTELRKSVTEFVHSDT
jgi:hypothetical protein